MMDLNYFGTVNTVQALLPGMLDRGSGYIVNFSSGAGFLTIRLCSLRLQGRGSGFFGRPGCAQTHMQVRWSSPDTTPWL
jgi:hypothetical protein